MIFQLFVPKHLTKTLCLFFLCFRSCFMSKYKLIPLVCSRRIHGRVHFTQLSNLFSQNILINCVSLTLMILPMFRSESLAIACSVIHHQLCASGFPHSKIILNYFPPVETFLLMRGTFPLEEFLFVTKLREISWKLAFDLATSTSWVVIGAKKEVSAC